MLKFIKHHVDTITGIEIYPVISFLIFFTFFLLLIIYVIKVDKRTIKEVSNIPLDKNDIDHEPT